MNKIFTLASAMAVALVGVVAALVLLSNFGVNILRLELTPTKTITVSGTAKQQESNQIARFSASVSKTGNSKEEVDQEIKSVVESLVQAALEFGIPESNVKTEYYNIYQEEMTDFESGTPTVRQGPWRGSTNVSFSKVPREKTNEFSQVLVNTGATSIDGPSFGLENPEDFRQELTQQALENAREKASQMASSQGLKLGKIIGISETGTSPMMPFAREMGAGGAGDFYPGEQEVSAQIVVTFELR